MIKVNGGSIFSAANAVIFESDIVLSVEPAKRLNEGHFSRRHNVRNITHPRVGVSFTRKPVSNIQRPLRSRRCSQRNCLGLRAQQHSPLHRASRESRQPDLATRPTMSGTVLTFPQPGRLPHLPISFKVTEPKEIEIEGRRERDHPRDTWRDGKHQKIKFALGLDQLTLCFCSRSSRSNSDPVSRRERDHPRDHPCMKSRCRRSAGE